MEASELSEVMRVVCLGQSQARGQSLMNVSSCYCRHYYHPALGHSPPLPEAGGHSVKVRKTTTLCRGPGELPTAGGAF